MRRGITMTAAGCAAALLLAGCGGGEAERTAAQSGCTPPDGAVAIAAAGRANAPGVRADPAVLGAVEHAIATETYLAIIDTGGRPRVVEDGELRLTSKNPEAQEDERNRNRDGIGRALQGVRSTTPEAAPLEALGLAAATVRARSATGTVVLADSGLQTTGALDYTQPGMLTAEPERLAAQVQAAGQLPDLSGITVLLAGIGSTAAPQPPLDNAARVRLQQQWLALVTAAGAACVYLDEMPNTQPAPSGVPPVSLVQPPQRQPYDLSQPLPLREDVLNFKDNSPELVNPADAQAQLAPLVEQLRNNDGSIRLTGTTASGGEEPGRLQLSKARAETAKDLFEKMGVDADRITTEGVGTNFPGFESDLDPQGNQIEEIAARNRSVIVTVG